MYNKYYTRNGNIALINGVSEYYNFGENHIILSGNVNNESISWDISGRVLTNKVIGLKEKHELDLVSWDKEQENGLYYFTKEQIGKMK